MGAPETVPDCFTRQMKESWGDNISTGSLDYICNFNSYARFLAVFNSQAYVTAESGLVVRISWLAGKKSIELIPCSHLIIPVTQLTEYLILPFALIAAAAPVHNASCKFLESCPQLQLEFIVGPAVSFGLDVRLEVGVLERTTAYDAQFAFLALGSQNTVSRAARSQRILPHVGFLSIAEDIDLVYRDQKSTLATVWRLFLERVWKVLNDRESLSHRNAPCLMAFPVLTCSAIQFNFPENLI